MNIDTPTDGLQYIDPEQVRLQNGEDSPNLWIVIDDVVYDCTHFVKTHSGGDAVIRRFAGRDCSWQYHRVHGSRNSAASVLDGLKVGRTRGVENPYPCPGPRREASI